MFVGGAEGGDSMPNPAIEITDSEGKKVGNTLEATQIAKQCWFTMVLRLESYQATLNLDGQPIQLLNHLS